MAKTVKEQEKEEEYFMADVRLFLLWRLSRASLLPTKKHYFTLDDLFSTYAYDDKLGFEDMRDNINVDNRFEVEFYSDSKVFEWIPTDETLLTKFNKAYHKKILASAKNLRNNTFTSGDFTYLATALHYTAYDDLLFTPKEGVNQDDPVLHKQLDNYIQSFINGELLIYNVNYYNFQKQKELFIKLIRDMKAFEQYGRNFIVWNSEVWNPFKHDGSSLFIHTIYALEFLWYIKVLSVSFDFDSTNRTQYNINIIPDESFKKLTYEDYRKENPKTVIEWYDAKKCTLTFAGKKIPISKTGKETDATLLISTLLKNKSDDYLFNDEILEEWWHNVEDQKKMPKNKVYHAGQAINKTMQLKVGIEDFLDITTAKIRINPKYRAVDK